jgi:hypothetical protein
LHEAGGREEVKKIVFSLDRNAPPKAIKARKSVSGITRHENGPMDLALGSPTLNHLDSFIPKIQGDI